jgi:hypothetical protein
MSSPALHGSPSDLLSEDPAEALARGPIVVPRSRDWVLSAVLVTAGVLGLVLDVHGPATAIITLGLGLALPFLWTSSLTLTRDGLLFGRAHKHLFVPWSAIDTERDALVSSINFFTYAIEVPLRRAERGRVEVRKGGKVNGRGLTAALGLASLVTGDEVRFTGRIQGGFTRISPILMHVARALGTEASARREPAEDASHRLERPKFDESVLQRKGRYGVSYPVSLRPFPALCCECGVATSDSTVFDAFGGLGRWLGALAGSTVRVGVSVPHCLACAERLTTRFRRFGRIGTAVGGLSGLATPLVLHALGKIDDLGRVLGVVSLTLIGGLIGSLASDLVPFPVKVKASFNGKRVTAHVKNETVAAKYLAALFPGAHP